MGAPDGSEGAFGRLRFYSVTMLITTAALSAPTTSDPGVLR